MIEEAEEEDEDEDIATDNLLRVALLQALSQIKKDDAQVQKKLEASITDYKASVTLMA